MAVSSLRGEWHLSVRSRKRRARDSNPQPIAGHLISSQTAGQFAYPPKWTFFKSIRPKNSRHRHGLKARVHSLDHRAAPTLLAREERPQTKVLQTRRKTVASFRFSSSGVIYNPIELQRAARPFVGRMAMPCILSIPKTDQRSCVRWHFSNHILNII